MGKINKLLSVKNLSLDFGSLRAVDNFSIDISHSELVGLIGPNGAGKTSVFNILSGVYEATSGELFFLGKKLKDAKVSNLVKKGIARTFQNIRLFKNLSVIENVMIASDYRLKYGIFKAIFRSRKYWKEEKENREEARKLLSLFNLEEFEDTTAGNLSYGNQRKLEIARALATKPKLLLLDEPAAGMNPTETEELMQSIKLIRDKFNISILLIEHDMKLVLGICEKLVVLDHGVVIASGNPYEVINDKYVVEAYLGKEEAC